MKDLNTMVFDAGIMPILFAEDESATERVVRTIERTEIPAVEILQRGETAEKVLKEAVKIKKNAYIGAGTVCTLEHCKRVVDLGADFIVAPGYNAEVVDWCVKNNVPVYPGVSNPTEIMMAANAGLKVVKVFPFYQLGGETYLNAIAGPFPDMKFIITGHVSDLELHYLSNHKIAAVGGVWPFQGEVDHTVISEEKIVERLNFSLQMSKHFRHGWQ
ncbi:MAG: hypothetical protein IJC94_04185 [Oscillospiraceae bacterium]|nr:hypothetical protein [Oscillospiraceae bacterium]